MKPPSLALLLLLCVGFFTASAGAQPASPPPPGMAPVYSPWDASRSVGTPCSLPPEKPRARERAPDFSRRLVELGLDGGAALPLCAGEPDDDGPCGVLGAGVIVGLSALYRPGPYFAFGGAFHFADFGAGEDVTPAGADGGFYEASAVARVYMLESGHIEPYLELWLGGGAQRSSARPSGEPHLDRRSFGVGGRVGGGVDFYLGEQWRLGPTFAALRSFATNGEQCRQGQCRALDLDQQSQLLGAYVLALRVTLGFGSRL
jgi:hypothetical protein